MYEYTTTFYPVMYYEVTKGEIIEQPALPFEPQPETLYQNPEFIAEINRLGRERWELVTVSPLLRSCYDEKTGVSFSLTAGYYLFWRRSMS